MDDRREIRRAVDTGKVLIGSNSSYSAIMNKKAKLVILASNAKKNIREDIEYNSDLSTVPIYNFKGTSVELGEICGKPFPISALSVLNPGDSKVLHLSKGA